jgi:hypothetical protein
MSGRPGPMNGAEYRRMGGCGKVGTVNKPRRNRRSPAWAFACGVRELRAPFSFARTDWHKKI